MGHEAACNGQFATLNTAEQRYRRAVKPKLLQTRCKLLSCLRYKAQTSAKARKGYQKHCEQRGACQATTPAGVPYYDIYC